VEGLPLKIALTLVILGLILPLMATAWGGLAGQFFPVSLLVHGNVGDKVAPFSSEKDKTEEPTPHRLREARKKGQVFRSMELISAANLIAVLSVLLLLGSWLLKEFQAIFRTFYGQLGTIPGRWLPGWAGSAPGSKRLSENNGPSICHGCNNRCGGEPGPGGV